MKPHIKLINGRWGYVSTLIYGAKCSISQELRHKAGSWRFRAHDWCRTYNLKEGRL